MTTLSDENQKLILNGKYLLVRDKLLQQFYEDKELFRMIYVFVKASGGGLADAKDVFQDAIVLLDRNLRTGKYEGKSSLRTYFTSIAKWRWVALRRSKGRNTVELELELYDTGVVDPELEYLDEERKAVLNQVISQMNERCQRMLNLYKLSHSMEEIAAQLGFANAEVAKNEVYKCRQKLKEYLQKLPEF